LKPPFRNSHFNDGVVTAVSAGELVFRRRMLSGRARQAIWLKRIHQSVTMESENFGNADALEFACLFLASSEETQPSGIANQMSLPVLFNTLLASQITTRKRSSLIDLHRWSFEHTLATSGASTFLTHQDFSQEYDLLIPAIHGQMGFVAESFSPNAVEVFTRIEYEWVDVSIGEMAALQFNWGLDPVDFDREHTV